MALHGELAVVARMPENCKSCSQCLMLPPVPSLFIVTSRSGWDYSNYANLDLEGVSRRELGFCSVIQESKKEDKETKMILSNINNEIE